MTAPKRICLLPDDGWSWVEGPKPPYEENAIEYVRADLAAVQPMQGVWNKCTFDLSGAGYDCAIKDGDARHGAYGEGQKVFWDGTTINAEGLYILSKPALDKRIAAAQPAYVRVKAGEIERAVWLAMAWAVRNAKQLQGDILPAYTDNGNSDAETACRIASTRIIAALEPQPDPRDEVIAEAEARGMQRAAEICKSAWIQTPEPLTARDCYDAILAAIPKGGE